jgi:hypothetical protein
MKCSIPASSCRTCKSPGKRKRSFAGFLQSPLTDSNRRPPPYQVSGRYGVRSLQPEAVATGRLTPYLRSMESDGAGPDLTDDLDYWEIPLKSGEIVNLRAHGVKDEGDVYVFAALMKGSPPFEYELAWIPSAVVDGVEGGWPTPRA